jgi:hypothetical protein
MAGSASDYLEQKYLDAALKGLAFPVITDIKVGLFNGNPYSSAAEVISVVGGVYNNEVTYTGYIRQSVKLTADALLSTAFEGPDAVTGAYRNKNSILFPEVDAHVDVTHMVLFDNLSNPLFVAPLTTPKSLDQGDRFSIPTNGITIIAD